MAIPTRRRKSSNRSYDENARISDDEYEHDDQIASSENVTPSPTSSPISSSTRSKRQSEEEQTENDYLEKKASVIPWQTERTQNLIIMSFWIFIILCIPFWWKSTSVKRLALPLERIDKWQNRECPITLPVTIEIGAGDQRPVNHLVVSSDHRMNGFLAQREGSRQCSEFAVMSTPRGKLPAHDVSYRVVIHEDLDLAETDVKLIEHGHDIEIVSPDILSKKSGRQPHPGARQGALDRMLNRLTYLAKPGSLQDGYKDSRVVKTARSYKLVFSLLLQDANDSPWQQWQVESAIRHTITPLLEKLEPWNVTFTIETQIQYYSPLTIPIQGGNHQQRSVDSGEDGEDLNQNDEWFLEQHQLKAFVNTAEWNLGSFGSIDPVLHFLLYVPSKTNSPLYIKDKRGNKSKSNGFLLPQWGGVVIYNEQDDTNKNNNKNNNGILRWKDLRPTFELFSSQLSTLLGLSSESVGRLPRDALEVQNIDALAGWRVDVAGRRRILDDVQEAINTLGSIKALVIKQENMQINDRVKQNVNDALNWLDTVKQLCDEQDVNRGGKIWMSKVASAAGEAAKAANNAFFNPTMVAMLYFPDEHKYAVYTPLFGPVAMPLLVGLIKQIMKWYRQRKEREQKQKVQ